MVSYLAKLAAVAAFAIPAVLGAPAPAPHHLKIRNPAATDVIKDSWIVVYNEDVTAAVMSSHISSVNGIIAKRALTAALPNAGFKATWAIKDFKAYNIIADAATIASIAAKPEVQSSASCLLFKIDT
jgi:hypothetical protein